MRRLTTEDFIIESKQVHGDCYIYTKVKYINSETKVCIVCPTHGEFWQEPRVHISGRGGCPDCGIIKRSTKRKTLIDFFISRSNEQHNKYNYSKVEYINNRTNVCIICPEHGEFWQTPGNHLRGQGCPKCKINGSKIEIIIEQWLKNHNKLYENQKRFKGCKGKRNTLPFDFYLPDYNLCIEYDGEHHFRPSFGEKSFRQVKINDKIKNEYCLVNSIRLIRIPYWNKKLIPSILSETLSS